MWLDVAYWQIKWSSLLGVCLGYLEPVHRMCVPSRYHCSQHLLKAWSERPRWQAIGPNYHPGSFSWRMHPLSKQSISQQEIEYPKVASEIIYISACMSFPSQYLFSWLSMDTAIEAKNAVSTHPLFNLQTCCYEEFWSFRKGQVPFNKHFTSYLWQHFIFLK